MQRRITTICLLIAAIAICPAKAMADVDSGAKAFEQGNTLLAKGDFAAATAAYEQATKAEPKNDEYKQQFMLVRQIIKIRESMPTTDDKDRYAQMAASLHNIYHHYGIYGEALKLDAEVNGKLKTADSATMLGETYLAIDKNAEAAKLLGEIPEKDRSQRATAMMGIAYARQGESEKAHEVLHHIELGDDAGPELLFDAARLNYLCGHRDETLKLLIRTLEQTPPSMLEDTRKRAANCKDLGRIVTSNFFQLAMRTESKVPESKCSGGSSCGKCPNRAKCAGGKTDAKAKDVETKDAKDKSAGKEQAHSGCDHK